MDHTWIVEEVDCGHLGVDDFFACSVCRASGGPAFFVAEKSITPESKPPWKPFFGGAGIQLPEDCEEAQKVIAAYKQTDAWKEMVARDFAASAYNLIEWFGRLYGFKGTSKGGQIFGGIPQKGSGRIQVYDKGIRISRLPDIPTVCDQPGWKVDFSQASGQALLTETSFNTYNAMMHALHAYYGPAK